MVWGFTKTRKEKVWLFILSSNRRKKLSLTGKSTPLWKKCLRPWKPTKIGKKERKNKEKKKGKNAPPLTPKGSDGGRGDYTADDIYILEGLEPVRKRPGMYIGSTGADGLHHLVWEIFDKSRDEAMGGFANEIEVAILPGDKVRVADNGRGIPVGIHKQTGVSALETVMTTLHAGGKFGGESYKISGGLHGVGASVVNALSIWLKVEV